MSVFERAAITLKSLRQLGPEQVGLYGLYRLGIRSGYYRWCTPVRPTHPLSNLARSGGHMVGPFSLPDAGLLGALLGNEREALIAEAEEIVAGKVRLFGAITRPLSLALPGPLAHWTAYERNKAQWADPDDGSGADIKFIWEPARFGWAFPLGRAYRISGDERYAGAFWWHARIFWQANPPNLGPHWASGQEVALRLLSLVFSRQVFQDARSSSAELLADLDTSIAAHARRIPPTLIYARSQNNNHLLSEAVGLYAAGVVLREWPEAASWRRLGWRWLNTGFQRQIHPDGTYVQHSTNYHRLMLQLGLWAYLFSQLEGVLLPQATMGRLESAVYWLFGQTDLTSGEMTNLGANDGANILGLAPGAFRDARPTLQAAGQIFCGEPVLPPGPWDEMAAWLGVQTDREPGVLRGNRPAGSNLRIDAPEQDSWGSLRAAVFHERPSHADQLHVELWWRGINLARDPGTYRYHAPPPWENGLAGTAVHNTVLVDGCDQMQRAGRFLWLDWAQAKLVRREIDPAGAWARVTAAEDGYARLGVQHERTLGREGQHHWIITDRLLPAPSAIAKEHSVQLHWLLPDWDWELADSSLILQHGSARIGLRVRATGEADHQDIRIQILLVRAGVVVKGDGPADARLGWYSPTYGIKQPAISLLAKFNAGLPICLVSEWTLPEKIA